MKSKLEELQEDIRSKLPRLMEVKEGCVIDRSECFKIRYEIINKTKKHLELKEIVNNEIRYFTLYKGAFDKFFNVIGHPILLSDIKDYLLLDEEYGVNWYNKKGRALRTCIEKWKGKQLSEQDQELINMLHTLIEK